MKSTASEPCLDVADEHKQNNKQTSHFLKNLFENRNISVLK